jgi:hypothetical protein
MILSCSGANSPSTWNHAVLPTPNDDVSALAFQHIDVVAERRRLDFNFGKVLALCIGPSSQRHSSPRERDSVSKLHWETPSR